MPNQAILVTGAAGFIGFHVARRLLAEGHDVTGLDSLNSYYDPALKHSRLAVLRADPRFDFTQIDLADRTAIKSLFATRRFATVIHFAAQAGVRYSIEHPHAYADANLEGFVNVLEGCRHGGCRHLIYASSSSVYGANTKLPFSVSDRTDHPISLYAATKRANELLAHSYSHLYRLPVTGLRFFNGDPAELVTTAISNFSYFLNGAAVNIPPANIIFFTAAEGGGFQIQFTAGGFDTTQGFNCADSFCEFDAFGDQLFTGSAPFITLTAGTISPVDFDQQAAQGGADGSLGTGTTTSFTGPTATPEPATLSLLALGALGVLAKARKK